jgi:mRNA interferase MazF
VICDAGDVVVVPFPFTDSPAAKRRPALAISQRGFNLCGHVVACMITTSRSARWPGDLELDEAASASLGLPRASIVRSMKLFTIDNRLIVRKIGSLGVALRTSVTGRIGELLLGAPADPRPARALPQ